MDEIKGTDNFTGLQEPYQNLHENTNTNDPATNIEEVDFAISGLNDDLSVDEVDSMSLEESIRFWALKTNQSHQSINLILEIIRKKTDGKQLPRCARTLLKTSRNASSSIVDIGGGQYWYYGIKNCLTDFFR